MSRLEVELKYDAPFLKAAMDKVLAKASAEVTASALALADDPPEWPFGTLIQYANGAVNMYIGRVDRFTHQSIRIKGGLWTGLERIDEDDLEYWKEAP